MEQMKRLQREQLGQVLQQKEKLYTDLEQEKTKSQQLENQLLALKLDVSQYKQPESNFTLTSLLQKRSQLEQEIGQLERKRTELGYENECLIYISNATKQEMEARGVSAADLQLVLGTLQEFKKQAITDQLRTSQLEDQLRSLGGAMDTQRENEHLKRELELQQQSFVKEKQDMKRAWDGMFQALLQQTGVKV